MNISGVLVHALPEKSDKVRQAFMSFPGVEVHAVNPNGRMVVTLEREDISEMADTLIQLQNTDGVLSASVVYHHCEEDLPEEDVGDISSQEFCVCTDLNGQEASR